MLRQTRSLGLKTKGARERLFRIYWWENKITSLRFFGLVYNARNGLATSDGFFLSGLGESFTLHEASVLAWRDKRRHDLARSVPLLWRVFHGRRVHSYGIVSNYVRWIPVHLW